MAVTQSFWEQRRIRRELRSPRPRRGPRLVQIGITDRCNYRCLMCAVHSPLVPDRPPERDRPEMPLAQFRALVQDLHLLGTDWIDLVGVGEPMLHPDFLEMAVAAKAAGLKVNLSTNGALLTPEKATCLAEIGIDSINVSMNTGDETTYREVHPGAPAGARERIIASLAAIPPFCRDRGLPAPRVALSGVLFKATYRHVDSLVRAGAAVGAGRVAFLPLMATPETQELVMSLEQWQEARGLLEAAERLSQELGLSTNAPSLLTADRPDLRAAEVHRRISCYAGHVFGLVYADGQVRFCCGCAAPVGNINHRPFGEIWRGEEYARLRRMALGLPRTGQAPEQCVCFGFCPHAAHNITVHNWLYPHAALPAPLVMDKRLLPGE